MSKPTIRSRVVGEHASYCCAVQEVERGYYTDPWCNGINVRYRDKRGQGTGRHRWLVIDCRDNLCEAQLRICLGDMLEAVGEGER